MKNNYMSYIAVGALMLFLGLGAGYLIAMPMNHTMSVGGAQNMCMNMKNMNYDAQQMDLSTTIGDNASMGMNMSDMNMSDMNHDDMNHDPMQMSMADMGAMLEGKTGDYLDKAFLEGMIPHHQGAIEMAEYLVNAKHPELKELGEEIIVAQQGEINQMQQWLKEWGYSE